MPTVSVFIRKDIYESLLRAKKKSGKSIGRMINEALVMYLAEKKIYSS